MKYDLKLDLELDIAIETALNSANCMIEEYNSENSKIAYTGDIKYLTNWFFENTGLGLHEITKEHLIMFIMHHVEKHKISTIERRIASLSRYMQLNKLENPCYDKYILILLRKLTEKYGCSKSWGHAITLDVLNAMLSTCKEDGLIGIRDAALLLFGFSSGGRRRTEIATATLENLRKNPDGSFIYELGKSKTNKTGESDPKPLVGRAAVALTYWLNESGIKEGGIFRAVRRGNRISSHSISNKQVARIVKLRIEKAGYNPSEYTAHSLRSGFVTESGKRGKPIGDIMAMTGHRSLKEVMRYYKSGDILNNSAAYLAG